MLVRAKAFIYGLGSAPKGACRTIKFATALFYSKKLSANDNPIFLSLYV